MNTEHVQHIQITYMNEITQVITTNWCLCISLFLTLIWLIKTNIHPIREMIFGL